MDSNTERKNLITVDNSNDSVTFSQKIKGLTAQLLVVLMTVASTSSVQLLERKIPDLELNTMRFSTAFVLYTIFLIFKRELPVIEKNEIFSTLGLSFLSCSNSLCLFVAVTFIPVSSVQAINMTCGILSGIVLFRIFWDEAISLQRILFGLLCVCGVILIIQPDFIFKITKSSENFTSNKTTGELERLDSSQASWMVVLGYALSALVGIGVSTSILLNKRHPYLGQNILPVLFWSFLLGTVISAVAMAIVETPVLPSSWTEFIWVTIHCVTYILGWPCALYAMRYVSGNTLNIVFSTSIVFYLISQYTVLSSIHPGHRNWMEVVGAFLVLIGSSAGSAMELFKSQ